MNSGALAIYVRGDFNASLKNKSRTSLLSAVIDTLKLSKVSINSPTYHHFTGNGEHDSVLDLLLYGGHEDVSEVLVDTVCKLKCPLLFSHHDILVSECSIPSCQIVPNDKSTHITAPRVENERFATKWSEEGVAEYVDILSPLLSQIRECWGSHPSQANVSLLMSSTYSAINLVTKATNKVTMLGR